MSAEVLLHVLDDASLVVAGKALEELCVLLQFLLAVLVQEQQHAADDGLLVLAPQTRQAPAQCTTPLGPVAATAAGAAPRTAGIERYTPSLALTLRTRMAQARWAWLAQ